MTERTIENDVNNRDYTILLSLIETGEYLTNMNKSRVDFGFDLPLSKITCPPND